LLLATAAPRNVSAKVSETINQVYDTNGHPTLSLKNVNGNLVIEGWDQKRIEVSAVKMARNQEILDELKVHSEMNNNHLRIEVKYDFDEDDYNDDGHGNYAAVNFTIKVPRGTEVSDVALVNGDIDISNVDADAEVASVNGDVSGQDLGGRVTLATVNGEVALVANSGIKAITLNSVNGDVRLTLPKKFDASIDAGTVHGDITAEGMDVDVTKFSGTSMRGTIGKGTLKVNLTTVNGSIKIKRDGENKEKEAD
jgi:DUF4097 and DUF4098 domain-containing protein YvlB